MAGAPESSAKLYPVLAAFNRGEVSREALGRVDIDKMRLAAECQLNWLPEVLGPMRLRPGLQFVVEVPADNPVYMMEFKYSKTDTALLVFTNLQMQVVINGAYVTRPSVTTVILDPTFTGTGGHWNTSDTTAGCTTIISSQCSMTALPVGGLCRAKQAITVPVGSRGVEHGIRIVVSNGPVTVRAGSADGLSDQIASTTLDTGTHCLVCTPTTGTINLQLESQNSWQSLIASASIDAAGTLVVPTPWPTAALASLRYDQSLDEVFVACYGYQQQVIQRRGARPYAHGWSVAVYRSSDGPFNAEPDKQANFTPGGYIGNATLASDQPYFQPAHVGGLFRLFMNGQTNFVELGANNAFTPPVRVTGVGATRNYDWTVSATYVGQLTFQRSYDGPDSGFIDVATQTSGFTGNIGSSTGGTGGTPDLDNVICWERVGFKGGNYTSGTASVGSNYNGGGGYGICRVTTYTDDQHVNVEVLVPFPSLNPTSNWVSAEWSGVNGWPTSVAFHEGRLGWYAGGQIWLSASDNFISYADINLDGTPTGDGGAIDVVLGSGPGDTISWGLSLTRLLLGREESIMSARSSNFDQPLTPSAIVIRDCSDQGAQRLRALRAGKRGIFVQQSNARVYELAFDPAELDYSTRDLTRTNLDIGKPGFVDIAVSRQRDRMAWLPRSDGQCAALLYDYQDEVEAWWRMQTLGWFENVAVLPNGNIEDDVYFVVRRVINGVTRRYIEKLAYAQNCVGSYVNEQLDCHLVFNTAGVTTVQHAALPSTSVLVWADGAFIGAQKTDSSGNCAMPDGGTHYNIVVGLGGSVQSQVFPITPSPNMVVGAAFNGLTCEVFADQQPSGRMIHAGTMTVAGGVVTLPPNWRASSIVAFFGYCAPFMSAKLAYAAQGSEGQQAPITARKKVGHVGLVLQDTMAGAVSFGQRMDMLDPLPAIEDAGPVPAGQVWNQYDQPMLEVPGDWDTDARLCLYAQAPNPATVNAAVVALATT